jgi:hypothetical protein
MTEILVALITGGLALVGVIVSNKATESKIQKQLEIKQAVTDTKIEELTREVRAHNNFAQRMPVVENEIRHIEEEVNSLKHYHEK